MRYMRSRILGAGLFLLTRQNGAEGLEAEAAGREYLSEAGHSEITNRRSGNLFVNPAKSSRCAFSPWTPFVADDDVRQTKQLRSDLKTSAFRRTLVDLKMESASLDRQVKNPAARGEALDFANRQSA